MTFNASEPTAQILIVDDDSGNREGLTLLLQQAGYEITATDSGESALQRLAETPFAVIITDLFMPGISGLDILRRVKERTPQTHVILMTGHASTETAVEAMKEGAFDYLTKPINVKELKILLDNALEKSRLVAENEYLRQQLRGKYHFANMIGSSPTMQAIFKQMEKIVQTDSTVLILGESGTGKELVASAVHYNSARKEKPFIAINCGAIPGELLESELFGHVKGAFTGAGSDKAGKFEAAEGGTIFLDEIGTMPMQLQMKLLRVLQEREVERIGSSRKIRLNVRIISATNADLAEMVKTREFREDLFYRLNVIPLHLPPLRERREDIPLLVKHFLKKSCEAQNHPPCTLCGEAAAALQQYDWPGNVRELENVIERAVALVEGESIGLHDLPTQISQQAGSSSPPPLPSFHADGVDLPALVAELECRMIQAALESCGGVKTRAAELLHLNRTTLVEKIRRYNLPT
jgi:DNA-binding NtrC family response regulator